MIITNKTQADGAFVVVPRDGSNSHQIQITVRDGNGNVAVPAAGTLTITVRTQGAREFEAPDANVIDLTSRDNWLQTLNAAAHEMRIEPTGLDADKTYDIAVESGWN